MEEYDREEAALPSRSERRATIANLIPKEREPLPPAVYLRLLRMGAAVLSAKPTGQGKDSGAISAAPHNGRPNESQCRHWERATPK